MDSIADQVKKIRPWRLNQKD